MKRRRPDDLTLWDAAHVTGHLTMSKWWKERVARRTNLTESTPSLEVGNNPGVNMDDVVRQFPKCRKVSGSDDKLMTTYTVAIRASNKQKKILKRMLRVSNAAYNWCLWLVRERGIQPKLYALQKIVSNANLNDIDIDHRAPGIDFIFSKPNTLTDIRQRACKKFTVHYETAMKRTKNKAKFRTKDSINPIAGSFQVQIVRQTNEKDWRHTENSTKQSQRGRYISLLPRAFDTIKNPKQRFLRLSKNIDSIPPFNHQVGVTLRPDGRFVLRIPCDPKYTRVNRQRSSDKAVCGVDPGSRAFVTVFDATRHDIWQVGNTDDRKEKIRSLQEKIDEIDKQQERLEQANENEQKKEKLTGQRTKRKLWFQLRNKVDAVHAAVASELVHSFDLVSLGKICVKSIVKNRDDGKNLHKRAKRDLLGWRHHAFRLRLQHRARGTPCQVIIQDESYTSMTCGNCDKRNRNLGSSETFKCPECHYEVHRDANGARNILRKTLKLFPEN